MAVNELMDVLRNMWNENIKEWCKIPGKLNSERALQATIYGYLSHRNIPSHLILVEPYLRPIKYRPDLLLCKRINNYDTKCTVDILIELKLQSYSGSGAKFQKDLNKFPEILKSYKNIEIDPRFVKSCSYNFQFTKDTNYLFMAASDKYCGAVADNLIDADVGSTTPELTIEFIQCIKNKELNAYHASYLMDKDKAFFKKIITT